MMASKSLTIHASYVALQKQNHCRRAGDEQNTLQGLRDSKNFSSCSWIMGNRRADGPKRM
jgi:hypothetical protein